jgi:hypothetical protein
MTSWGKDVHSKQHAARLDTRESLTSTGENASLVRVLRELDSLLVVKCRLSDHVADVCWNMKDII